MEPTVESKPVRIYCVQLGHESGDASAPWPPVIRIRADVMCRVSRSRLEFKREGQVVGYVNGAIKAWWIEEQA